MRSSCSTEFWCVFVVSYWVRTYLIDSGAEKSKSRWCEELPGSD